jgi:hypothetical protein
LMSIASLLVISSCSTIPEGPSLLPGTGRVSSGEEGRGGLRLLSMDIPQSGNLSANIEYWATIHFEAGAKAEIQRACFNFSGGGQSCVDVQAKDVTYGSHPYFRVPIRIPVGSKRIDSYAEYIRDGKTYRTNSVTYHVIVLKKPQE